MRSLSAFAVAALAAVALAVGLPGPAATAAPAATPVAASTSDDVTVSLAPGAAGVVRAGDDLKATVSVHNGTSSDLDAGTVAVYLDRTTFSSRSQIESWFDRPTDVTTDALGAFMTTVDVPAVKAGGTADGISVTIPASSLDLSGSDWGAKAFGARYAVDGVPLTEQHSSVVYYPTDSFAATSLAVAVPITVPGSATGLIGTDALASYTSPNGILTQELDEVRGRDVALGIDPMILASIRILGNDAPPSAVSWLQRLETAPNETFALAYADADVSALRQAGATSVPGPIDFADEIAAQQKRDPAVYRSPAADQATSAPTASNTEGSTPAPTSTAIPPTSTVPTTQSLLAFDYTLTGFSWPLENTVASSGLTASGSSTTILASSNVKSSSSSTENAAATVGTSRILVSDSTLSDLIRAATSAGTDAEFAGDVSELSAELATLSHERPSDARTLFATVGRNWATTGSRLDDTLATLSRLAWASPVGMTKAVASASSAATLVPHTASPGRVAALKPLVQSDQELAQFSTALATPSTVTAKSRLRMLALSSTSWADNADQLTAEIDKAVGGNSFITSQIKVVQGSPINVLGDRSSLPVSLQNDTTSPATVYLRVVPSNYNLNVEKNDVAVTIQPKSQQRVTVPVQSVANGKVMLTLSLTSRAGAAISQPTQIAINVQAGWETVITLVFGVAVVLLFGGGIYRSIRRRRTKTGAGT
jgi:hypothetical protein